MITDRVKELIRSKSLTVNAFAKIVGIPQTTLNNQLRGKRGLSLETINDILMSFEDISAEWLLRGSGSMYIADNLPPITGNEAEDTMTLHATIARQSAKLEELESENLKLINHLEFMEQLNYKVTCRCHDLERELEAATHHKKSS